MLIYYLKLILFTLIIGEFLLLSEQIELNNDNNDELLSDWELNFHKFINNYAANTLIKPFNQPINRTTINNFKRITVFNRTNDRINNNLNKFNNVNLNKIHNLNDKLINKTSNHFNLLNDTNLNKNLSKKNFTNLNNLINLNNSSNKIGSVNSSTTITTITTIKPILSTNTSNIVSINTNKTTTTNTNKTTTTNKDQDLDHVIFTPKECGRSFDEDYLVEGELNNLVLYNNKKDTFFIEHNKLLQLEKQSNNKEIDNKLNTKINTFENIDLNLKKLNENINNKLDNLVDSVNNLDNKPDINNLNIETFIKNFNFSTTNQTELNLFRSILNNRNEYFHYGENRIINGQRANPGQFPWTVSIQVLVRYPERTSPPAWRHICGGSIINSQWILTAAHCLEFRRFIFIRPKTRPKISVVVGSLSWNNSENIGQRYMVKDYRKFFDPFDSLGQYLVLFYDIGLIRLEKNIQFTNGMNGVGAVERVCLPKLNDHNVNDDLRISGWGSITQYPLITVPKYLNYIDLPLVSNAECDKRYWPIRNSNRFICAGYLDDARLYGICMGDSGSPLVGKNLEGRSVQVGIASGGRDRCGSGSYPATYTKISAFREWIKELTGT